VFPKLWWQGLNQIGIDPLPDATYQLNGYIYDKPTDLTVDSQIPEIPTGFQTTGSPIFLPCRVSQKKQYSSVGLL